MSRVWLLLCLLANSFSAMAEQQRLSARFELKAPLSLEYRHSPASFVARDALCPLSQSTSAVMRCAGVSTPLQRVVIGGSKDLRVVVKVRESFRDGVHFVPSSEQQYSSLAALTIPSERYSLDLNGAVFERDIAESAEHKASAEFAGLADRNIRHRIHLAYGLEVIYP